MFFGLNKTIANVMHAQLFERSVWKEYYCRVAGRFPDGEIKVDKPILTISPKHGLNRLRDDGKPSCTVFERVFYDEERDQSVVLAKPLTGRTHQIRYIPQRS
jgi:23S rRNA-/tRNA-specific pseudouridylate synthase